jgi:hypothetical protein
MELRNIFETVGVVVPWHGPIADSGGEGTYNLGSGDVVKS